MDGFTLTRATWPLPDRNLPDADEYRCSSAAMATIFMVTFRVAASPSQESEHNCFPAPTFFYKQGKGFSYRPLRLLCVHFRHLWLHRECQHGMQRGWWTGVRCVTVRSDVPSFLFTRARSSGTFSHRETTP